MQEIYDAKHTIVILSGGLGTRLREVAGNLPKALVPLCGKPFLWWKLRQLEYFGARQIVLLTGKGASAIEDFLSVYESLSGDLKITFVYEGSNPLGTGGALLNAAKYLPEKFILTYGDNLLNENFQMLSSFDSPTVMVTSKIREKDSNNIRIESGNVVSYSKNNTMQSNYMDYGYMLLTKEGLSRKTSRPLDLVEILRDQIEAKTLQYFETKLPYFEIGTPESLVDTERALRLGLIAGLNSKGLIES